MLVKLCLLCESIMAASEQWWILGGEGMRAVFTSHYAKPRYTEILMYLY